MLVPHHNLVHVFQVDTLVTGLSSAEEMALVKKLNTLETENKQLRKGKHTSIQVSCASSSALPWTSQRLDIIFKTRYIHGRIILISTPRCRSVLDQLGEGDLRTRPRVVLGPSSQIFNVLVLSCA